MCGILGMTGFSWENNAQDQAKKRVGQTTPPLHNPAALQPAEILKPLLSGLRRLEYRGYDSAGIALWTPNGLKRWRAVGPIHQLDHHLDQADSILDLHHLTGIAHTRWATHGAVTEANAHPQGDANILLVHNGVIENAEVLRCDLQKQGVHFESDTDTEVIAALLRTQLNTEKNLSLATLPKKLTQTLSCLEGSFSILVLMRHFPDLIVAYRQGLSPLAIGLSPGTPNPATAGSDAVALSGLATHIAYLESGDLALLTPAKAVCFHQGKEKALRFQENHTPMASLSKEGHATFMRKEIAQQPDILSALLQKTPAPHGPKTHTPKSSFTPTLKPKSAALRRPFLAEPAPSSGPKLAPHPNSKAAIHDALWNNVAFLRLVGCGSALYAGHVASYFFEAWANLPTFAESSSEFCHKSRHFNDTHCMGLLSQSGETADTLAALLHAQKNNAAHFSVLNVPGSSMDRTSDVSFYTYAGTEVSVASTKAFTAQLMILLQLALAAGKTRGTLSSAQQDALQKDLSAVPGLIQNVLAQESYIKTAAQRLENTQSCLFLGRQALLPTAQEGALKMKELSYIHAEAFSASELKHGPIALLQPDRPCIFLMPSDDSLKKNDTSLKEILARGAPVILLTDQEKYTAHAQNLPHVFCIQIPKSTPATAPFVYTTALQLLAYHTATLLGKNVDRPRNLAKSVTVE